MALIKDYEIQGTGVTVPDAYHVITDIKVHKRTQEIPLPPDTSLPSGLTNDGVREAGSDMYWAEGYVCRIWVTMWATKQARTDGLNPIGIAGENATEVEAELSIGIPGLDQKCIFMLDMDSTDSDLVQAYTHLKSLDYYAGCTED